MTLSDRGGTLTERQRRFVEEYLIDGNATQSAIRAGYSRKTAASIGEENLRKPEVARAIAEVSRKLGVGRLDVIRGASQQLMSPDQLVAPGDGVRYGVEDGLIGFARQFREPLPQSWMERVESRMPGHGGEVAR